MDHPVLCYYSSIDWIVIVIVYLRRRVCNCNDDGFTFDIHCSLGSMLLITCRWWCLTVHGPGPCSTVSCIPLQSCVLHVIVTRRQFHILKDIVLTHSITLGACILYRIFDILAFILPTRFCHYFRLLLLLWLMFPASTLGDTIVFVFMFRVSRTVVGTSV